MATTKNAPVKKKPVAKKAAVVKKAPVKKPTAKSKGLMSFRLSEERGPFFSFKVTEQTLYWLLLSVIIFALGLWVISLHFEVQKIYDSIEITRLAL